MIAPGQDRLPVALSLGAAAAAALAAVSGLVWPDLYRPLTPEPMIPGALSQDTVSLAAAAGLALLAPRLRRQPKLWLIWAGLVGYLIYAYGLYAFERLTNPLFLVYVAAFSGAAWALLLFVLRAEPGWLRAADPPPPRRAVAGLLVVIVALFSALWLSILIPAMATRTPPEGNAIFVFDLAIMLPLSAVAAALLWRARPLGDLLAVPLLLKVGTLGLSVLLGTLYRPLFGQPLAAGEIAIYALLGFGPLLLLPAVYRRLDIRPPTA